MTEIGVLKRAYLLSQTAVLVFGWHEADPVEPEQGVRIEVRLRADSGLRGTESAAQKIEIDRPLFRADLFDLISEAPGNFLRAHFHPAFDGVEPVDRHWDDELTADPMRWLARQLSDLEAIVSAAGASALVDPVALAADAATLRRVVGEVVTAAEGVLVQVRAGEGREAGER